MIFVENFNRVWHHEYLISLFDSCHSNLVQLEVFSQFQGERAGAYRNGFALVFNEQQRLALHKLICQLGAANVYPPALGNEKIATFLGIVINKCLG